MHNGCNDIMPNGSYATNYKLHNMLVESVIIKTVHRMSGEGLIIYKYRYNSEVAVGREPKTSTKFLTAEC